MQVSGQGVTGDQVAGFRIPGGDGHPGIGLRGDFQQAPCFLRGCSETKPGSGSAAQRAGLQQVYTAFVTGIIGMVVATHVHIHVVGGHHLQEFIGLAKHLSVAIAPYCRGVQGQVPEHDAVAGLTGFGAAKLLPDPVESGLTDFGGASIPADDEHIVYPIAEIKGEIAGVQYFEQGVFGFPVCPGSLAFPVEGIEGGTVMVTDGEPERDSGPTQGFGYTAIKLGPHGREPVVRQATVLPGNHVAGEDDGIGLHTYDAGYGGVYMPVVVEAAVGTVKVADDGDAGGHRLG